MVEIPAKADMSLHQPEDADGGAKVVELPATADMSLSQPEDADAWGAPRRRRRVRSELLVLIGSVRRCSRGRSRHYDVRNGTLRTRRPRARSPF